MVVVVVLVLLMVMVVGVGVGVVVVGEPPVQAGLAAHVGDGLLQQLEALAARRAGLHGAGEVQLLQQLLQLQLRGQAGPVGRHQEAVHWEGGGGQGEVKGQHLPEHEVPKHCSSALIGGGGVVFGNILSRQMFTCLVLLF